MPCNSDYMRATGREVEMSKVACLLDELDGKPVDSSWREGYHPRVYPSGGSDRIVQELCERLQHIDVTKHSLEMQIWWRDHQKADEARVAEELRHAKTVVEREDALAKLSEHERRLLGIKS